MATYARHVSDLVQCERCGLLLLVSSGSVVELTEDHHPLLTAAGQLQTGYEELGLSMNTMKLSNGSWASALTKEQRVGDAGLLDGRTRELRRLVDLAAAGETALRKRSEALHAVRKPINPTESLAWQKALLDRAVVTEAYCEHLDSLGVAADSLPAGAEVECPVCWHKASWDEETAFLPRVLRLGQPTRQCSKCLAYIEIADTPTMVTIRLWEQVAVMSDAAGLVARWPAG